MVPFSLRPLAGKIWKTCVQHSRGPARRLLQFTEFLLSTRTGQTIGVMGALSLEGISWWQLTSGNSGPKVSITYVLVHALASTIIALTLMASLPQAYRGRPVWTFILFFSIGFFIPYLGMPGLALVVLYALRFPNPPERADWLYWSEPELPHSSERDGSRILRSPGAMVEILQNSDDAEKKVHSVVATRNMDDQAAVPILRVALKDMEDEVRLQAYTFIDRREQSISNKIKEIQSYLDSDQKFYADSDLHIRLAQNYWELVEGGLVQGNVKKHMLQEAESHLRQAMKVKGNEPSLSLLCTKVLIEYGEYDQALQELSHAESGGLPFHLLQPLRAEIAFLQRDFNKVRAVLSELETDQGADSKLSKAIASWKGIQKEEMVMVSEVGS